MMSGTLAVLSQSGCTLSFFDLSSGEKTLHLTDLKQQPHELCLDEGRNLLYISHTYRHGHFWSHGDNSHEISVVDITAGEIVDVIDTRPARAPHGLYIDGGNDILYVSVEELPETKEAGGVIGIDLKTRKVVKTIASQYKSHWFIMTLDGRKAYTCNKTAPFISVLDLVGEQMIGKIDVPSCEEPHISPDGKYVYFATPGLQFGKNAKDPAIQVIDTETDQIVRSIPVDAGTLSLHVTSRNMMLAARYHFETSADQGAAVMKSGSLAMYDPVEGTKLGEVEIGKVPLTIRSSPDGKFGFVANVVPGTVSVVDLDSKKVVRTIEVDVEDATGLTHQGAHGMAYIP